jgi:carboxyl-terminal processing protease
MKRRQRRRASRPADKGSSMKRNTLLAISVVAAGLALAPLQPSLAADKNGKEYEYLQLFGQVFDRIRSDYVDKVDEKRLIEGAIDGMLASLDPHSSYMDADEFKDMETETKGEFGGLGISITLKDGMIEVITPIDGTPAAKAGIKAGDMIEEIDHQPVRGLSLSEAVERLRGPIGSKVELLIRRGDRKPFAVSLSRTTITVPSVTSTVYGSIGYLRITSFTEQTGSGVKQAMAKIAKRVGKNLTGLVIDLRNDPGGLLNQAIEVSDDFLDRGEIVSTRGRHPDDDQRWFARRGDLARGAPIVVLINGGTASASEIVTGALQDHQRAIVMGTRSFGKGTVQTIIPLSEGNGAMRLTTAEYFTPSGRSIQRLGITPDIEVRQATLEYPESRRTIQESRLRGALKNPAHGETGAQDNDAATAAAEKTLEQKDYQLSRAIDLLRGIARYRADPTQRVTRR